MDKKIMKVPPLSELYVQKHDYDAHKKKLQKIMSDRKNHLNRDHNTTVQSYIKRNSNNYFQKYNMKSMELARENYKIIKKIEEIKPAYQYKSPSQDRRESRSSTTINSRAKIIEQERQNYRIKSKVQSMNSSLNSQKLIRDYRKSVQIKNRITHFKTEENKVVLKAGKYLGMQTSNKNIQSSELFKKMFDPSGFLPKLQESHSSRTHDDSKIKNEAQHYKKEDIIKNKIQTNNKLFKLARQKRLKTVISKQRQAQESQYRQKTISQSGPALFFPTQVQKKFK